MGSVNGGAVHNIGSPYHWEFGDRAIVVRGEALITRAVAKSRLVCDSRCTCPASKAFALACMSAMEKYSMADSTGAPAK